MIYCRRRIGQDVRQDLYWSVRETKPGEEEEDIEAQTDEPDEVVRLRTLRLLLPLLPRDCARFTDQKVYATPSAMLSDMVANLPITGRLNEDQMLFVLRFGDILDTVWKEEQELPPERRSVYHMLLLGQGGSGKTHVVQNLIFPVAHFIWPPSKEEESLMVVAAKNSQAKNISTEGVRAKTLHRAGCMRIQSLRNQDLAPGKKEKGFGENLEECSCLDHRRDQHGVGFALQYA